MPPGFFSLRRSFFLRAGIKMERFPFAGGTSHPRYSAEIILFSSGYIESVLKNGCATSSSNSSKFRDRKTIGSTGDIYISPFDGCREFWRFNRRKNSAISIFPRVGNRLASMGKLSSFPAGWKRENKFESGRQREIRRLLDGLLR